MERTLGFFFSFLKNSRRLFGFPLHTHNKKSALQQHPRKAYKILKDFINLIKYKTKHRHTFIYFFLLLYKGIHKKHINKKKLSVYIYI